MKKTTLKNTVTLEKCTVFFSHDEVANYQQYLPNIVNFLKKLRHLKAAESNSSICKRSTHLDN